MENFKTVQAENQSLAKRLEGVTTSNSIEIQSNVCSHGYTRLLFMAISLYADKEEKVHKMEELIGVLRYLNYKLGVLTLFLLTEISLD